MKVRYVIYHVLRRARQENHTNLNELPGITKKPITTSTRLKEGIVTCSNSQMGGILEDGFFCTLLVSPGSRSFFIGLENQIFDMHFAHLYHN